MASIEKHADKSGQVYYIIRVYRGNGQSRMKTRWNPPDGWSKKAIERELNKFAADYERKCKSGEIISREEKKQAELEKMREAEKVLTLKKFGESVFMPSKSVTMSENARSSYQGMLNHWIYPALGELKLPDITSANITALLLSMQAQGKAQATCVKVYNILLSLFKMAYLNDVIAKNPMDKVQRPRARKDEIKDSSAEAYTVEQVNHILSALESEPLKWRAYICLLIDTGIRRGEACGLRWKDINFKENTITICGNLCYTPERGVYLDTPKNGRTRIVDVGEDTIKLLCALRAEQASSCLSEWVFTQDGKPAPMHPQSPDRYFKKFGKRYDVPDFHPHKLRHTSASIAITNGADVVSVSERLGHSDTAVTLRMYAHANEDSIKRAGQIVRDALSKREA